MISISETLNTGLLLAFRHLPLVGFLRWTALSCALGAAFCTWSWVWLRPPSPDKLTSVEGELIVAAPALQGSSGYRAITIRQADGSRRLVLVSRPLRTRSLFLSQAVTSRGRITARIDDQARAYDVTWNGREIVSYADGRRANGSEAGVRAFFALVLGLTGALLGVISIYDSRTSQNQARRRAGRGLAPAQ